MIKSVLIYFYILFSIFFPIGISINIKNVFKKISSLKLKENPFNRHVAQDMLVFPQFLKKEIVDKRKIKEWRPMAYSKLTVLLLLEFIEML